MSRYIRNRDGQTYFFTVVTHGRQQILTSDLGRSSLRVAFRKICEESPFHITAVVLLPDHLHMIWELPPGDSDYSTRWKRIKALFTKRWNRQGGVKTKRS